MQNNQIVLSAQVNNFEQGDKANLKVLAFDQKNEGTLLESIEYEEIEVSETGYLRAEIPDSILRSEGLTHLQLCLDDDNSTTEATGIQSCSEAGYVITSCTRHPVPPRQDGLFDKVFRNDNTNIIIDSFCTELNDNEIAQQLSETGETEAVFEGPVQFKDGVLTVGQFEVEIESQNASTGSVVNNTYVTNILGDGEEPTSQTLVLDGSILTIAGGNSIDLSQFLDNTDTLNSITCAPGHVLVSLEGSWVCQDSTTLSTETISTITILGTMLTYTSEDGSSVDWDIANLETTTSLTDNNDNTFTYLNEDGASVTITDADEQTLTLASNILTLANGTAADTTIDLTPYLDNTDNQIISASLTGTDLVVSLEDGGTQTVDLSSLNNSGTDNQLLTLSGNNLTLEDGGTPIDLTPYLDNTDNQVISASLTGTDLLISLEDGGSVTVPLATIDTDTDDQTLSLIGNNLSIADGNTIDISSIDTTVDNQSLTLSGNDLELSSDDGTDTVDLSAYLDDTDTDDQTLSFTGNSLTIADGNTVSLAGLLDNTDAQEISISGNTITLSNGTAADTTVDLSSYLDNTDNQSLSLSGTMLTIADGNTIDISSIDTTIADDQEISLNSNIITLSNGTAADTTIDLTPYLDNTDNQIISASLTGTDLVVSLEDGGTQTVDLSSLNNSGTDNQLLTLSGNNLTLEDGGTPIDLTPYLDNTDNQVLSLAGSVLTVSNGNSINLSSIDTTIADDQTLTFTPNTGLLEIADGNTVNLNDLYDNTDNQSLTLSGNDLELSSDDGTDTVDLSAYLDDTDTDDQTLSFNTTSGQLTIADGNSVDMSVFFDDTDTDDQTLSLAGTTLTIADGNSVDISSIDTTIADDQTLSLSGGMLTIADGNTINISSIDTDTDDQTLSLAGTTLTIADGNSVDISSIDTTIADDQTLSLAGSVLTISDGNNVNLSTIDTDTDDQTLSIAGNVLTIADGNSVNLPAEIDGVIGNEVLNATSLGGLELAGGGTASDPYTLGLRTDCNDGEVLMYIGGTTSWECVELTDVNAAFNEVMVLGNSLTTNINAAATNNLMAWNTQSVGSTNPAVITHSTTANNSRIIVQTAGIVKISGGVSFTSSARYNGIVKLRRNGTAVEPGTYRTGYTRNASGNNEGTMVFDYIVEASAGDYFELLIDRESITSAAPLISNASVLNVQFIK